MNFSNGYFSLLTKHKLVSRKYSLFQTHFSHRGVSDLSQSFTWKFQVEIKSILLRIFKVKERVKMFWQITFAPEGVSSNSALFFSLRLRQLRQFKNYLRHTSSLFRAWYNKNIFLQQNKIREPARWRFFTSNFIYSASLVLTHGFQHVQKCTFLVLRSKFEWVLF